MLKLKPNLQIIVGFLLVSTFIMQLGFLYILINPISTLNNLDSVQTINKVSKAVILPATELPQVGIIGDKKVLADIDTIKKANQIDSEVYKDAKNGDYVLGYSNRLIIYRPSEQKVIYDGQSPQQRLASGQQNLVSGIIKKITDANLLPKDYNQTPQMVIVSNPDEVRKSNEFYKDAQKDDIIATFSNPNLVIIYRPSTSSIVKSGQIQVSIK